MKDKCQPRQNEQANADVLQITPELSRSQIANTQLQRINDAPFQSRKQHDQQTDRERVHPAPPDVADSDREENRPAEHQPPSSRPSPSHDAPTGIAGSQRTSLSS